MWLNTTMQKDISSVLFQNPPWSRWHIHSHQRLAVQETFPAPGDSSSSQSPALEYWKDKIYQAQMCWEHIRLCILYNISTWVPLWQCSPCLPAGLLCSASLRCRSVARVLPQMASCCQSVSGCGQSFTVSMDTSKLCSQCGIWKPLRGDGESWWP